MQKVFLNGLLCAVLALSFPVVSRAATLEELETRINRLEQTLDETRQTLEEARQALEKARQALEKARQERQKLEKVVKAAPTRKKEHDANVYLDGKIRPTPSYSLVDDMEDRSSCSEHPVSRPDQPHRNQRHEPLVPDVQPEVPVRRMTPRNIPRSERMNAQRRSLGCSTLSA